MKFRITTNRGIFTINRRLGGPYGLPGMEPTFELINKGICYMKMPSFAKDSYEKSAVRFLKRHKNSQAVIIDLRNNSGGNTPVNLLRSLMNKEYRRFMYKEIVQEQLPHILEAAYCKKGRIKTRYEIHKAKKVRPLKGAYKGRVFVLVDYSTRSAGEDFSFPFKDNGRGTLIGTKTAGTNGSVLMHKFGDDICIGVGAVQVLYPDESRFEGIGIKPDITIYPTLNDIKSGKDRILETAISMSKKQ
jgi:carboxyl-terminal processing protease